jgi:hypothetical protein
VVSAISFEPDGVYSGRNTIQQSGMLVMLARECPGNITGHSHAKTMSHKRRFVTREKSLIRVSGTSRLTISSIIKLAGKTPIEADNSTTGMLWRDDGINIAYSFNGRGGAATDEVQAAFDRRLHEAIDKLVKNGRITK